MDKIVQSSYDLGRVSAQIEAGKVSPWISYTEATKPRKKGGYGRNTVDRWVEEGLIEKIKDGPGNSAVRPAETGRTGRKIQPGKLVCIPFTRKLTDMLINDHFQFFSYSENKKNL